MCALLQASSLLTTNCSAHTLQATSWIVFFLTHFVAQADLKLVTILPQLPWLWDYMLPFLDFILPLDEGILKVKKLPDLPQSSSYA